MNSNRSRSRKYQLLHFQKSQFQFLDSLHRYKVEALVVKQYHRLYRLQLQLKHQMELLRSCSDLFFFCLRRMLAGHKLISLLRSYPLLLHHLIFNVINEEVLVSNCLRRRINRNELFLPLLAIR